MSRPLKAFLTVLLLIAIYTVFLLGNNGDTSKQARAAESSASTTIQTERNTIQEQLRQLLLERKQLLENMADSHEKLLEAGRSSTSAYLKAKRAALLAGLDLCNTKAEQIEIRKDIVMLYKKAEASMKRYVEDGRVPQGELEEVRVARLEAEIKLLKEQLKE
jgi:hypothetical protein